MPAPAGEPQQTEILMPDNADYVARLTVIVDRLDALAQSTGLTELTMLAGQLDEIANDLAEHNDGGADAQ